MTPGLRIGKYEVGARLGKGSFGVVHLAVDAELGREVAIKFLRPEFLMRDHIVQRFIREARAAAKIGHPGIVTVFECGQVIGTNTKVDGTAYIVMERLQGQSLGERITARTPLTYSSIVAIGRQLATALHAAHAAGIIHRDLKPDNVFLVPDAAVVGGERVKVLDFGIAKLDDPGPEGVHTHSKMILGTPRYMSPEQARSSTNVDLRSDIYALGCMLYELVSGRAPFEGDSGEIMFAHQTADVPPASSLIDNVPEALDTLLRDMLQKSPDKRPATMQVVDAALGAIKANDVAPAARSKAKFVGQKIITAVAEPPRPKRISAAGELTASRAKPYEAKAEAERIEIDMFAEVTDPDLRARAKSKPPVDADLDAETTDLDQPLMQRTRSDPVLSPSEEHTAPVLRQEIASELAAISRRGPVEPTLQVMRPADDKQAAAGTLSTRRGSLPLRWIAAGAGALALVLIVLVATNRGGSSASSDTAVASPDAGARATEPKEERAWIDAQCKIARTDKNWIALERCGEALIPHSKTEGRELVELAKREAIAEVHFRGVTEAADTGDLIAAERHAKAIPLDSDYRAASSEALERAGKAHVERIVSALDARAADQDCSVYESILADLERDTAAELRDEITRRARPCTPRTVAIPIPSPSVRVEANEPPRPPPTALPPPDCTDKAAIAELEARGDAAYAKGQYHSALARFEAIAQCKSAAMSKAYVAACRAHVFQKAKYYFARLDRESLAQICLKEGFDPRK